MAMPAKEAPLAPSNPMLHDRPFDFRPGAPIRSQEPSVAFGELFVENSIHTFWFHFRMFFMIRRLEFLIGRSRRWKLCSGWLAF
jgi:hypothetical protein